MPPNRISIALTGNPNSGKTTLFNGITGTRQKVGNWPGVTVEKKEGQVKRNGYDLTIIDLPGTYSLTPFSIEEIIARNFILDEHPDVVVDIIDSSNLERSLYLATQLRELDCKLVFALNMADLARERGIKIDAEKLSELLDIPVVFTVGNKNEGIDDLLNEAIRQTEMAVQVKKRRKVRYNNDIENAVTQLIEFITSTIEVQIDYDLRWTAIKLLENDKIIKEYILKRVGKQGEDILDKTTELRRQISDLYNDDPEIIMTDERYGFIAGIIKEVVTTSTRQRVDISRNIDLVLTNRFIGFPIFFFFIWMMFQLTFSIGAYPMEWIDSLFNLLFGIIDSVLPDSLIKDLILNGMLAGVGSVIVFLPNILILFFFIAIFEDTGYMSRSAFLMDKIMHLIGLHGKSFIPMLMGFGCNVPAVMAARTLESEKDRILTILITPFMSCSAKLPIYIVLTGAFFGPKAGTVIFAVYLVGIILSIISGRLFRTILLRGADAPFVMELPPYRVPMFKSLLIHMWDRGKVFLKKMTGIILFGSVIVWILSTFPLNVEYSMDYEAKIAEIKSMTNQPANTMETQENSSTIANKESEIARLKNARRAEKVEKSYMGAIGKFLAPIFKPIGVDWRGSVALLSGFVAKEIVVSTLAVLHSVDRSQKRDALKTALHSSGMTPLSALAMMLFVLLYLPCIATVAAISRETGSFRWMAFSILYSTSVAWIVAFMVYQGGKLLGFT